MFDTFNAQQEEEDAEEEGEDEAGEGDLIVSASISDTSLTTGQAFTLTATVQNQGTDESPDLVLSYYRSSNATISTLDAPVGTDAVGRLAASEIRNESISLMAPSRPDTYYYGACVDSVSSESDTPINCSTGVRVIVAEDEDDAQDDHTPDESDTSSDSIQDDDALSSPPPTWVFAGDVPDADRAALREEMEAVRSWSADQYGVAATGFTVLVGADSEALAPVFQDVVFPGPVPYSPVGIQVLPADNGSAVILIDLGSEGLAPYGRSEAFSQIKHSIVHEYFHVLQGQLASGFAQLLDGKIAYKGQMGPFWLVEGLAEYADYAYSPSRLDRRTFFDRNTPYRDLADLQLDGNLNPGDDLMKLEDKETFQGGSRNIIYNYAMAFAASYLLVEQAEQDSYVQYWKLLHDRPTWQQAFEESFGIGIEDFYEAFEEWLPSQLPSSVEFLAYLHWPGKEALSRDARNRLLWDLTVDPDVTGPSPPNLAWGGSRDGAQTIIYTAGASWTGYLSLSWYSDSCTKHLLGWYKDGELTDQRAEATLVEFTGISSSLEWTLPARPDMLPRLNTLGLCGP